MSSHEQRHEIIAKLLVVAVSATQIDQKPQQRWVLWVYIQIYMFVFVCVRLDRDRERDREIERNMYK